MKDFITSQELKKTLGSFFTNYYNDQELLDGLLKGLSLQHRQLDRNLDEIRGCASVATTPVYHTENWYPLILRIDRATGSYMPLTYGGLKAIYGEDGAKPIYDKLFRYGDYTDFRGLETEGVEVSGVTLITDGIDNPTTILVEGTDFAIDHGKIVFIRDLMEIEKIKGSIDIDLLENDDIILLWGYKVDFDLQYLARQWGYLINYERPSGTEYNQVLWNLWRARYYGLSESIFRDLLAIYLKSPVSKTDGEVVETLYSTPKGTVVITSSNVYHLDPLDASVVSVGDILAIGSNIGYRFSLYFPATATYAHSVPARKYENTAASNNTGDDDAISANYLVFEADRTPVEFKRERVKYATLTTDSGVTTVPVTSMYRFGAKHWTMEIKETSFLGGSQQSSSLQLYTSEGTPLLVEPYSGTILPNPGQIYLYSDRQSLLKYWKYAESHRATIVRRILMVGLFPDMELNTIRNYVQGMKFTNGVFLGVDIITSDAMLDVLNEFPTQDFGLHNSFKDYDLIVVDALSGVTSATDTNGVPKPPEPLLSSVEQSRLKDRIQGEILSLQETLTRLDNDILLALSHNFETNESDVSSLYGLSGILGTPTLNSELGQVYYSEGKFSLLEPSKVLESEIHNVENLTVPTSQSYRVSDMRGKEDSVELVPVHSAPVDVTSTVPELVKELEPGFEYVYSIKGIIDVN